MDHTFSPAEAHRFLAESTCLIYFTKKDGTSRRMLTAPPAEGITKRGDVARVFDAEKGAWRSVCLSRIASIRPLRARQHRSTAEPYGKTAAEHARDIFGE